MHVVASLAKWSASLISYETWVQTPQYITLYIFIIFECSLMNVYPDFGITKDGDLLIMDERIINDKWVQN